jgi:hypothetical protein
MILRSALGHYEVTGNPRDADCIIGHSFGTSLGEGSPNCSLADFILGHAEKRPIIADRTLADAFPDDSQQVRHVVEGSISTFFGGGVGAWGTLLEAKRIMEDEEWQLALMVAQAHMIGRAAMQADKLGIGFVVPADLPHQFDRGSKQLGTKSELLWVPREVVGSLALRAQEKL